MSSPTSQLVSLLALDPATYRPHAVHAAERTYQETNCYCDILIELLHARGAEPLAAMGFTMAIDFEGDQWTFFKPPPGDLQQLFGVDIHEMQPYRPLPEQIEDLIVAGRTVIVELDSWYLPDTAATAYRAEHVKTSAAIEAIDRAGERLRYFHNAGLYELDGEDYRGVFRMDREYSPDVLAPYTEIVRFGAGPELSGEQLRDAARALLRGHLDRAPATNPFHRFAERLVADMPALLQGGAADYHAYAFATVRMAGAGFELAAAHVDWLLGEEGARASAALQRIVEGSKLLGFKLARRRRFDAQPTLDALAEAWDEAVVELRSALG